LRGLNQSSHFVSSINDSRFGRKRPWCIHRNCRWSWFAV